MSGHSRAGVAVVVLMVVLGLSGCSSESGVESVTVNPISGATGDNAPGTRYVGTGTLTLSKTTVVNTCSVPVDAILAVTDAGVANLTLNYQNPISDQIVEGETLKFVCTDSGDPRSHEFRATSTSGRYDFEVDILLTSGSMDAVVGDDGASVSGQLLGGSNVWDFSIPNLSRSD